MIEEEIMVKEVEIASTQTNASLGWGIFFGTLAGAAAVLLFTPVTGKAARDYLVENVYEPVRLKLRGLGQGVPIAVKEATQETNHRVPSVARGVKSGSKGSLSLKP